MTDFRTQAEEILNSALYEVWGLNPNDTEEYDKALSEALDQLTELHDKEVIRLRADIAWAMGRMEGLGHVATYLEKSYPSIAKLSAQQRRKHRGNKEEA